MPTPGSAFVSTRGFHEKAICQALLLLVVLVFVRAVARGLLAGMRVRATDSPGFHSHSLMGRGLGGPGA